MFSRPWEVVKREMVWYVVQLTDGASKVELMIGGSSYQIDFAGLTQTNVGTRRIRPIRRQLIMQDAENHCEIIKTEHLEVDLDRIREQLAAEHAKRKSAETVSSMLFALSGIGVLDESGTIDRRRRRMYQQPDGPGDGGDHQAQQDSPALLLGCFRNTA
jgi:hypothetical protein